MRLTLVVGAHVAILLALVDLDPENRSRLEPVMVSLITPPVPAEVAPPPPPLQPERTPKPVPAILRPDKVVPAPAPVAEESPAAITAPPSRLIVPVPPENPGASVAVPAAPVEAMAKPIAPVVPPRFDAAYLNNPRPEYPRTARRMGEHGKVMLRVYVAASGSVEKVEIRTSSGSPRLDQAARDAVEQWKFIPARQGDEPVAAWVLVPITFVLEG